MPELNSPETHLYMAIENVKTASARYIKGKVKQLMLFTFIKVIIKQKMSRQYNSYT